MSLNERGRSWSACAAVLILALLGSCAGQVEAVESDDVAVNAQAIQERYVVFSQTSTARWVNLLFSDSMTMLGKTVGVLHYTSRLGYRVSCGATFISPQFAVTASHCVSNAHLGPNSGTNPPTTPFNVTHVNTANLSSQALVNQLTVTGTWPNWTHTGLTEQNGYVTTTFPCTVHTACDTAFMRTGTCPLASSIQADIALVKCPTRKTNPTYKSAWTFVNTVDTGVQNVEVWWFHELYSLATQPGAGQPGPAGNFANYGALSEEKSNYHYRTHNYLPLRSSNWPGQPGMPYRQMGNISGTTWTDVPVCHGTSGSGVFERGTSYVFGPMLSAGGQSALVDGRLCEDMETRTAQRHLSTHLRRNRTAAIQAMSVINTDRQP